MANTVKSWGAGYGVTHVRITKEADEKLVLIARRKNLAKIEVLSRMILHYHANKLDIDEPSAETLKNIIDGLTSLKSSVLKIAGSSERTESFIKGLLSENRASPSKPDYMSSAENDNEGALDPEKDQKLKDALLIIDQLLSMASEAVSFDTKKLMQIRIPVAEFNRLKIEYDRLCM